MSEYLSLVNEHNILKTRIKSLAVDITGVWGEEIIGCTPEEAISAIEGKFSDLNTKLETANKIAYRAAWEC